MSALFPRCPPLVPSGLSCHLLCFLLILPHPMTNLLRAFKAGLQGFVKGYRAPRSELDRNYSLVRSNAHKVKRPHYSSEQQAAFAREFSPRARGYIFFKRMCVSMVIGGTLGFAVLIPISGYLGLLCLCAAMVAGLAGCFELLVVPHCTACRKSVVSRFGPFCPQCGDTLEPNPEDRDFVDVCLTCDRSLYSEKGRRYTIRNCTHCGVRLHEKGI